ncbi:MAG: DNA polymerase III subunit beta [Candidatus Omnitrophica bacterium]|nr:DNA polymerase III subunit beta [Candidatus Omnitrophota bacterium]MCM8768527.1 DNA polymerase III subunit beta [Candidatus Omnitrophota bacterium]
MEFTVERKKFSEHLDTVSSVVPAKPTIVSLSCVLLEAKDTELTLTTTDLETTIKTSLQLTPTKKGTTLLPAKKILSLIKQLTDDEIKFSSSENQVSLQTSSSVYHFFPMNSEDFPKLPKFSGGVSLTLDAALLKEAIIKTKFCIYPEEPRPHFRGALLDVKEDKWNLVATDTRRLALYQKDLQGKLSQPVKCLLPHRVLNYLSSLLETGEVEISVGKNQIFLKINNTYVISQLLEGNEDFPDYWKVIPEESKQRLAKLNKEEFESVMKRITLFTSERYNKVKFVFSRGKLSLSVSNPEVGEAQEKISIDYTGEDQPIAFNPDYIIQFLQSVSSEKILMGFSTDKKPVLMRAEDSQEYLYVAMPLKLD